MSDDLRVQVIRFNLGKNYENAKKDTVEVEENIFYSTPAVSADTVSADSTNLKPKKGLMITFAKAEDKTENVEKPEYEFIFSDVKKRHELSWGEIGEIALNSGKNFVKGMFCDENGFSLKRTAMTVGTVAALAFAAPVAAAAGASAAVVAGVAGTAKVAGLGLAGYMTFNGGKNIIEGTQKYYDSTTEAEAKASMSQAMDGAVEVAAAVPAFGIIKGGAAKGKKMASKKAEAQQNQPAPEGAKPAAEAPKPVEEAPKAEAKPVEEPKLVEEAPKAETKPVEEPKPIEEAPKAEAKPVEEPKPVEEAPKAETKPVEEPKPVEEAPKAETKPVEEPKPVEEAPKVETKPVEEPKPVEEAPKAEAKPVEEPKPVEEAPKAEAKPVEEAPKTEQKFTEAKSLSDDKNFKEFIKALLTDNPKNKDLVKRFLEDLKIYNSPEFTEAGALKTLTESAVLLGNRVNVFAHNGKLYLSVDGAGTYSMKLKAGTKPAAEAPKAEPKPVKESKPIEEASKAETKPVEELKPVEESPKAEAKPVEEPKPVEEAPKAEEAKPTEKPAENAAVDYNKVVRTEKEVKPDGTVCEYQWNAKGNILKSTRFDKDGKFNCETNYKYDSNGKKIEYNFKGADGYENIEIYNNGVVEKIKKKGLLGEYELTRVGDGIYEGIRTKKDGTQVKIRWNDKTNETTELGPVEAPKAAEQAPKAAETKPTEAKPVEEPKPVEEAPKAEEAKPAEKPAENAAVDYNKVVSTEKEVKPDGTVREYQWNAKGDILKSTSFDKDGKFICETNSKYDSNGKKIEHNFKDADGYENTKLYNNGVVEKIKTKGPLGEGDLTRVGDGIYEGIRTKEDGTQVKIRFNDKTYKTTELGPVE